MAYSAAFKRSEVDSILTDMKMSHDVILCKSRNEAVCAIPCTAAMLIS